MLRSICSGNAINLNQIKEKGIIKLWKDLFIKIWNCTIPKQ